MKRKFTFLIAAAFMLLTMMATTGEMWGQTKDEEVYKQTVFNSTNNSQGVSSYANSWYNTTDGFRNNITNANNNNNGWNFIKMGSKNDAYVGTIITNSNIDKAITKVVMTIDAITAANVNSIKLYTSSNGSSWEEAGTYTKAIGVQAVALASPTASLYYKIAVDCKKSSNGVITISKVEYYHNAGGTPTCATPTFSPAAGTYYGTQNVSIACTLDDATIYYTLDGTDPTESSSVYSSAIEVSETTTIKAFATKAGYDDSEIASATYTINDPIAGYNVNFEAPANAYTDWTFTNMESQQTGNANVTAHGGTHYGTTGGKSTASVKTESKVANPGTLTCYVTKQSGNTTASSWYIQVSSDGSSWTDVETQDATSMSQGTWVEFSADLSSYSDVYVRVYYSGSTAIRNIDDLTLTTASATTVATPVFSPESGTEFGNEGLSVTISQADNKPIYYTLDGSEPTSSSTLYENAINLTTTTTIKAKAYDGENASNVATATYTYVDPDAPGTQNNPYTVEQARAAIDAGTGITGVYATGIISQVDSYNSTFSSITYWISSDGTTTSDQLEVYSGKGLNNTNFTAITDVEVGANVVVYGTLKKYGEVYEFDKNNYLTSYTAPIHDVEAPTFAPAAGTYAEAQTVTMSCTTEGAAIHYTTDGTEPDGNSNVYSTGITVSETTTFKAKAIKGENASPLTTATYHFCSAESPYTVAQALAFHEYPTSTIWVHGIVSTAPTQAPTNSGQLTYYISDDGTAGENNQLEVYKGLGLNGAAFTAQDDIQVGDIVTITGIVKTYSSTIEFDTNNQLTYFERPTPTVPTITVDPTSVEVDADEHDGTISVTYTAIETDLGVEIHWFETSTSTEPLSAAPEWIDADFNTTSIETIDYVIEANSGAARTAYFKVCGADAQTNLVYSELVTVTQAAASQNYSLTVEPFENLALITYVGGEIAMQSDGTIQLSSGAQVMLNIVADEGYVIETLMVNGVNHAGDISNNAYNFEMPSEDVTISATAVEYIPPVVGNYVRINDISYLTDGAKVIIAARYDEDNTNKYYAMTNATSGKPTGVLFTSSTENTFEILPSDITDEEDNYYWTVGITENGYTFTNANDDLIGYNSSTNFATGGNNTEWNIEFGTSEATAMVANYEAFTITNHNQNDRGFALNSSHNFGPYSIANYTSSSYNFYLDFFVQGAEPVVTPSITLSSYEINAPANETIEILTITPANIENFDVDNLNADYCNADGSDIEGSKPNFVEFGFSENEGYKLTCTIANNTGEARTAYFKVIYDNGGTDVVSNVVTVNQAEYVAPVATITVADGNANIDVDANGVENATLAIAYENLTITDPADFNIQYYNANGDELGKDDEPIWMAASIQENATQDGYEVLYDVFENDGEARTAYFKVFAMGDQDFVYSNLVTINQAAYVVDYATLPFEWEGGPRSEFEALTGTSTYGVGDYAESHGVYRMKLDGDGDYIQIKTNEQPGIVTIGVKMIGGATTSHIIVKGSSDGDNFTDVEDLTISGAQNSTHTLETTNDFAATDRYVRLYFTKGSNVGVGPITIAQVDLTPSITVAPATLNLNCDGGDGELTVTHKNLADDPQLNVIFVESDGETITTCDWIQASINTAGNVAGHINANTGEARTAYLKVTGRDADNNLIKSNLVTFNQSAYTEPSIVFENTTLDIVAGGENRTMSFDYEGLGQDPTFSINFYESDGTTTATYDWIEAEITQDDKVDITVSANEGAARSAYFKVSGVNGEVNALSNLVTINQAAFVQLATYSLVTSVDQIVSGKHYLIASGSEDGTAYAMGNQNENNRSGVAVTIDNSQITETEGVYEFVINTHLNNNDEVEYYTIYDAVTPGYLYAASSSKNYLKTSTTLDDNGKWTIAINNNSATITAQGTNSRKLMRYNPNNNSPIFACYAEGSTTGNAPCLYVKDNDNDYEYYGMEITYNEPNIPDGETLTVGAGSVMTVPDNFVNYYPEALVIQEGGQLIHTNPDGVNATLQKVVEAYTPANRSGDGWYMIATPVDNLPKTAVASTSDFDLFLYNEPNAMWYAHWDDPGFETLYRGKGYLYANAADVDLYYAGLMKATDAEFSVPLSYKCDAYPDMKGFNLVGNPFTRNLKLGDMKLGEATLTQFYVVNPEHTGLVTIDNIDYEIKPGEGFFVQAKDENQTLEFNPSTKGLEDIRFIKIVAGNENGYDNAYINIGCGNTLRKTNIANLTSVYVMDQGLDYAATRVEELAGNMPVHFAPSEDGFFTITVEAKNIENINFMHLIDNIENTAINLLAEPTYTFKAGTSDNEDRFTLVFDFNNYLDVNENNLNDSFVYQSGDELILNGEGTLQVFDMMGRFVMSKEISGSERISTSTFETGVYVLRFVGETVMTQKIVIE